MRCKVIFCYVWQCLKGESPSNTRLRSFSTLRSAPQIRNLFFGKNNFGKGGQGPFDTRSMCLNCILHDLFRDTPLDHIWLAQICVPHIVFGLHDVRIRRRNVVKLGITEKILQNAVQTNWPWVNRTAQSNTMTKSHFGPISPYQLQCKPSKWPGLANLGVYKA